jgi:hypothetical protein
MDDQDWSFGIGRTLKKDKGSKVTEEDIGKAEDMIKAAADMLVKNHGAQNAFYFSWALAQSISERWRKSDEYKEMIDPDTAEGKKAQKLLSEFALGSILAQHERLHRAALDYQSLYALYAKHSKEE